MLGSTMLPFLAGRVGAAETRFNAEWASGIVWAYDAQGHHRTGHLADQENAERLAEEASARGASVVIEEFGNDRVEPSTCHVELDGHRVAGVPISVRTGAP